MLLMPSSDVRRNRSSRRAAPSSMEYSVWTWRWTKSPPRLTGADDMGGEVLLSGVRQARQEAADSALSACVETDCGTSWGKDASLRDHSRHRGRAHRQSPRTATTVGQESRSGAPRPLPRLVHDHDNDR